MADVCFPDPCVDQDDATIRTEARSIVLSAIDELVAHMRMDQGPEERDPHQIVDRYIAALQATERELRASWFPPPSPWEIRAQATGGGPCRCGKPFYTHVCLGCSPDYQTPGPGCVNCRNTGMDQTPCKPVEAGRVGEQQQR